MRASYTHHNTRDTYAYTELLRSFIFAPTKLDSKLKCSIERDGGAEFIIQLKRSGIFLILDRVFCSTLSLFETRNGSQTKQRNTFNSNEISTQHEKSFLSSINRSFFFRYFIPTFSPSLLIKFEI